MNTAAILLTKHELAERLNVKVSWIEDKCAARAIPFAKLGGEYRFTEAHVAEIIALFEVRPAAKNARAPRESPPPPRSRRSSSAVTEAAAYAGLIRMPAAAPRAARKERSLRTTHSQP